MVEKIPPQEDWDLLEKLGFLENWENVQSMSGGKS